MTARRTRLQTEVLESREVPALFYWRGEHDTNANNYWNYLDIMGAQATRMPTVGDDIAIAGGGDFAPIRSMYVMPGNRVDCDLFTLSAAVPSIGPPAHLYVSGAFEV